MVVTLYHGNSTGLQNITFPYGHVHTIQKKRKKAQHNE